MNRSAKDRIRSSPHYGHAFTRRTKAFAGGTIRNSCVAPGTCRCHGFKPGKRLYKRKRNGKRCTARVGDRNSTPGCTPLLKPGRLLRRYPWKNVVLLQSRKRLISDWHGQCPRPMVQMKSVTQPADSGGGAIPYFWSWPLDFLFLAPPRAHCIMRCGR